eukprot:CAMPEP_0176433512 /NCGR_PEP_ID=MMETSP0127-20121128/16068_1 /TAXON_ID=938130 /ORGANISM="Platyophrya macrostoma, Strain WH" /LENGTH=167 /DNA_ID=CAMNT_0017815957 /DNA_START=80 /DNA_END=581 /DNA_ORIENTATION=+
MVLITKQNKRKVYEYLLREGVIVIKRDPGLPEHKDTGVPNLHAMMLLKSLHSKNYVELVFCWHHFYYFVKTEGIKYLRTVLGIPDEVVPLTYKKTKKNYTGVEEEKKVTKDQEAEAEAAEEVAEVEEVASAEVSAEDQEEVKKALKVKLNKVVKTPKSTTRPKNKQW